MGSVLRHFDDPEGTVVVPAKFRNSFNSGVSWTTWQPLTAPYIGRTTGDTLAHPGWRRLLGKVNVGGGFKLVRTSWDIDAGQRKLAWRSGTSRKEYVGPILPGFVIPPVPTVTPLSDNDMNVYGTKGVNMTIPTSPVWNAAQFLGELREGLPRVNRNISPKGAADNYLGYEFGVKPLLSDIEKFRKANSVYKQRMRQLERDSGRTVRRRATIRHEANTEFFDLGVVQPRADYPPTQFSPTQYARNLTLVRHTSVRVWFSGGFTYLYQPPSTNLGKSLEKLDKVYGLEASPELIWELSPYSWLADWFANSGDVISNMSRFAQDGLVMKYGYVMCHQKVTETWQYGEHCVLTRVRESKQRQAASPFGFGILPGALTARQWGILSALGLSKGSTAFNIR